MVYVLLEVELNGGRLSGLGGLIVTEVFRRAMEGGRASIVHDPVWRPTLGQDDGTSAWSTCCCSPSRTRTSCSAEAVPSAQKSGLGAGPGHPEPRREGREISTPRRRSCPLILNAR